MFAPPDVTIPGHEHLRSVISSLANLTPHLCSCSNSGSPEQSETFFSASPAVFGQGQLVSLPYPAPPLGLTRAPCRLQYSLEWQGSGWLVEFVGGGGYGKQGARGRHDGFLVLQGVLKLF
eukprot:749133-Hanusia_phi.AAC.3